eukprot:gb/GEZN01008617.1/.p1 GENE.gb/GEZN01008617.1/~~gb/GEZN01008617.1/.p1  ORF type:complete len:354 (-),score=45.79 gb/GEZN01008617.1/:346-1284(-)
MTAVRFFGYGPASFFFLAAAYNLYKRQRRRKPSPGCYSGKTVVITGASSGIGAACAEEYAHLGADLILAARRMDRLEETKRQCLAKGSKGIRVEVVQCDVTLIADCKRLVDRAEKYFQKIDLLILNAGVGGDKKYLRDCENLDNHKNVMDVNYFGVLCPLKASLGLMRRTSQSSGQKSCVGIISSVAGVVGTPNRTAYSPSKFAVIGLAQALQLEELATLDVCVICPGYVISEIHDKELKVFGKERNLKKFMSAQECAKRVADATFNKDRVTFMTLISKAVYYFGRFCPGSIVDPMIINGSDSAFVPVSKQD